MQLPDKWFTALSENEDGSYTFISGRSGIDECIASGKYVERIEVSWTYRADEKGLPADDAEATLMEEVEERLRVALEKSGTAILTGIYTGQGQRQWIYIARSTDSFGSRLNNTLSSYPQLPIAIYAERDPNNQEYRELLDLRGVDD